MDRHDKREKKLDRCYLPMSFRTCTKRQAIHRVFHMILSAHDERFEVKIGRDKEGKLVLQMREN